MGFASYVLKRLGSMILVLIGVTAITFYISRGIPGVDPVAAYINPNVPLSPHTIEVIRQQLHLNDPLPIQYFYYLRALIDGNWGFSQTAGLPVLTALFGRLPATIELAISAVIFALVIGIPLGVISALRANKKTDAAVRVVSTTGVSIPIFWIGIIFQIFFFYDLKQAGLPYLPPSGRVSQTVALLHPLHKITGLYLLDSLLTGNWLFFVSSLEHILLPAFTLSLIGVASVVRVTRASMLEVLHQDHMVFARSKGAYGAYLVLHHAMRNAMVPILTTAGTILGYLVAGAVVVEKVFSWPGVGSLAVNGILNNDTNLIVGFVLLVAFMLVLVNLFVDLLYGVVDPRVKY